MATTSWLPKSQSLAVLIENSKKIAIKHWIKKALFINFVNLSIIIIRLQLNALTRRKGCFGRNEGKVLLTISYTQVLISILLFGCFLVLSLLQILKASKKDHTDFLVKTLKNWPWLSRVTDFFELRFIKLWTIKIEIWWKIYLNK